MDFARALTSVGISSLLLPFGEGGFVSTPANSTCEEMESYAATQIANRFNVPVLTVRIISNSEQHPGEEYERTTGLLCQEFVLDVVEKL